MAEIEEPTGGASGAPEVPEADGSQIDFNDVLKTVEAAAPPAPEPNKLDDDFVKKLESLDPGALPEAVRRKLEAPFLSNMSKKTTEFDTERKNYLGIIEKLTNRSPEAPAPTADQREILLQKLAEGDSAGVQAIIDNMVEQRTAPIVHQGNMENATRIAATLEPSIRELEPQVAQALTDNPQFAAVVNRACIENPQLGGFLLAGAAKAIRAELLAQKLDALEKAFPGKVKAAVDEYQKRLKALPSSTSKAGSGPSRVPNDDDFDRQRIRDEAWREAGGS